MSTDRVRSHLRVVRNTPNNNSREVAGGNIRRMTREADRVRELEAEFRREQRARIRMEVVAQRYGAPGWAIDAARDGVS